MIYLTDTSGKRVKYVIYKNIKLTQMTLAMQQEQQMEKEKYL